MTLHLELPAPPSAKYVYDFAEGGRELIDLLGGKGAGLAEMGRLGLPVPPGFTITTEACRHYLRDGIEPIELAAEIDEHLAGLEALVGVHLGQPADPLLVSVRSGARYSMPGMMETVLDIGLNDQSVQGLAVQVGDEAFALDSYRRLIQMFGRTVLGISNDLFEDVLAAATVRPAGAGTRLSVADLQEVVTCFKEIVRDETGRDFPQDPREQLALAIHSVFDSWNTERAAIYRRQEQIPDDLGTAVNVMAMVFGNKGADSGSGVAFTRDPASGQPGLYGDYLADAQGEDVVSGTRNALPISELERLDPDSYRQLLHHVDVLERHYRDLCDIEFTIERGRLWMLQTRVGKRTPAAAFRIACQLVDEGVIDLDEALLRVTGRELTQLMFPQFITSAQTVRLTTGVNASPGAAVGVAVFDSATAVRRAAAGDQVILIRRETTPDDLAGIVAATGILTTRGGKTAHAAVVARGMGKPCVCGAEKLRIDDMERRIFAGDVVINEGDELSIDGTTGAVYEGKVPLQPPPIVAYFDGELDPAAPDAGDLVRAVHRLLQHADQRRRLGVRANADTPADAARAYRFGAEGIGLCRTEHMFLGERRVYVERLVLADTDAERAEALAALLPLQRADFVGLFAGMDGVPVTIRLIDPPLHEFLPDRTELAVRVALANATGAADAHDVRLLAALERLHEVNPMLGLRGVRLGFVVPGLFAMQTRAVVEATLDARRRGHDPRPEIMVPLVATVAELDITRRELAEVIAQVTLEAGQDLRIPIGTMIELPRAALTAGPIAAAADFFSFGTNDLTQTAWGLSRDDVEGSFFPSYFKARVLDVSPFESLDRAGVGRLIRIAVDEGRQVKPHLPIGVCGEHGGDPDSIHFFDEVGVDYVSCSPFRVPVARLEAARAAVTDTVPNRQDPRKDSA
ncbi:MAG: pyruvate, orthophosphate dikinase [Pseudonocardiales bacterium]|nr:pyruvate, orthophosphate dikinase [Pseudonocardiales bacterium]